MMKKMLMIIVACVACANLSAKEYKLDSPEAQKEVLQVVKRYIAERVTHRYFYRVTGIPVRHYGAWEVKYNWVLEKAGKAPKIKRTYWNAGEKKRKIKVDPDFVKVIEAIDKFIAGKNLRLENVKVVGASKQFRFMKGHGEGTLRCGDDKVMLSWNYDIKSKMHVSGYKELDLSEPAITKDAKIIPFNKLDRPKIKSFLDSWAKLDELKKGEFESQLDFHNRKKEAKTQIYKDFHKTGITKNIYVINAGITNVSFEYELNRKLLHCRELFRAVSNLKDVTGRVYMPSHEPYPKIEIAGVKVWYSPSNNAIYCPVNKAKQIKKNLGNTWKFDKFRVWVRYNPRGSEWRVMKIVIPKK